MRLLSKKIQQTIPGLYEEEKTPLEEKLVHARFFHVMSSWVWFATEASAVIVNDEGETEYFPLKNFRRAIDKLGCLYDLEDGTEVFVEDVYFFGWVRGDFPEWGTFALSELQSVNIIGLGIERDKYMDVKPIVQHPEWKNA